MTYRIKCDKKEDREQLALLLIKSGYTVCITAVRVNGKNVYYVEYSDGVALAAMREGE